jgi:hypothetical protein
VTGDHREGSLTVWAVMSEGEGGPMAMRLFVSAKTGCETMSVGWEDAVGLMSL